MTKVFHFDSPRDRYVCDAVVIWCFDNRFELACRKFLKFAGVQQPDPIKVAGGPKSLASPEQASHRTFVVDQIEKSVRLHHTTRIIQFMHSDCGAYGGLAHFKDDAALELQHHVAELAKAAAFLNMTFPTMHVDSYFVNFEGVWQVPIEPEAELELAGSATARR
ncbi:MAG: hypothetical protein M3Z32_08605 [Acidobacteriota bacterium]|nr:hypothetical protein [Acidobacteriota bacterium]